MTNTELKAQIDTDITTATGVGSVSTSDVGDNMKAIVDYVDQEISSVNTKKEIVGLLSYDGTNFTFTEILNQTPATISWSKFSGTIIANFSSAVLTVGKTIIPDQSINTGGGYIVTARVSNSTNISMICTNTAGTNSFVPNFTDMPFKVEIYN